jgi:hypothetical protein
LKNQGVISEFNQTRKNKPIEEEEPKFEGYSKSESSVSISHFPSGGGLRNAAVESRFELCSVEAHPDRGTTGDE